MALIHPSSVYHGQSVVQAGPLGSIAGRGIRSNVSFESGSQLEDFAPSGGLYVALSQEVDLEGIVRTFADKNRQPCPRLRIARMAGEF